MEARRRASPARPWVTDPPERKRVNPVIVWARHHVPTRESIERNRLLRPVAHLILRPSLWRLNRRSVPRAAAVGVGCTVLFPVAHMPLSALASVPARANVPLAVAITIPGTFVFGPIWVAALFIGRWLLRVDRVVPGHPIAFNAHAIAATAHGHERALGWGRQGGHHVVPMIVGLLELAPLLSASAYGLAALAWRWRVGRRWRARPAARADAR